MVSDILLLILTFYYQPCDGCFVVCRAGGTLVVLGNTMEIFQRR